MARNNDMPGGMPSNEPDSSFVEAEDHRQQNPYPSLSSPLERHGLSPKKNNNGKQPDYGEGPSRRPSAPRDSHTMEADTPGWNPSQPIPAVPQRFGNNKESMEWLSYRVERNQQQTDTRLEQIEAHFNNKLNGVDARLEQILNIVTKTNEINRAEQQRQQVHFTPQVQPHPTNDVVTPPLMERLNNLRRPRAAGDGDDSSSSGSSHHDARPHVPADPHTPANPPRFNPIHPAPNMPSQHLPNLNNRTVPPMPTQQWTSHQFAHRPGMGANNQPPMAGTRPLQGLAPGFQGDDPNRRDYREHRENSAPPFRGNSAGPPGSAGQQSQPSYFGMGNTKIKKDDIGLFNPHHDDPDDTGIVHDGKNVIFTDIICFKERVNSFLDNADTREINEGQILGMFQTLLGGPATIWWSTEVPVATRRGYLDEGIDKVLAVMEDRFGVDPAIATAKFTDLHIKLKDIARDGNSLAQFVTKKLRYARQMGILQDNNCNWHGVMIQIWAHMDLKIRQFLRAPLKTELLEAYMKQIDESKSITLAAAMDKYPELMQKRLQTSSSSKTKSDDRSANTPSYQNNRNFRYDNNRSSGYNNNRSSGYNSNNNNRSDRPFNRDGNRNGNNNRDGRHRFNSDRKDKRDDGKDGKNVRFGKDKAYNIKNEDSDADSDNSGPRNGPPGSPDSHSSSSSSSDSDTAYIITTAALRTCLRCNESFVSRNRLFRHIHSSPGCAMTPAAVQKVQQKRADLANLVADAATPQGIEVIKEDTPPVSDEALEGVFTHVRIKVRTSSKATAGSFEICLDSGTGRDMIDRKFIKNFNHYIHKKQGGAIQGWNGPSEALREYATFTFFAPSDDGKLVEMSASAWLVDNLGANCLLGNAWMHPRKAAIKYEDMKVEFPMIGTKGVKLPMEIVKPTRAVTRRVTAAVTLTLQPHEKVYMPVHYITLPKGRSFMMSSTHEAISNALVDHTNPHAALAVNPTDKPLVIKKHTRLATIHECEADSAYFITSAKNAFTALTVASALGTAYTPSVADRRTVPSGSPSGVTALATPTFAHDSPVPSIGGEFNIDPRTRAICDGMGANLGAQPQPTLSEMVASTNSSTPYSDAVYQISQPTPDVSVDYVEPFPVDNDEPKPRLAEIAGSLNIKTPDDAPFQLSKHGARVYAANREQASRFRRICDRFAKVWEDKGPIAVPLDRQMKVPLVDGYQNAKLNSRPYPLSRKDRDFLDKIHDGLHEQGRMEWVNEASVFAHPVSIVKRVVHGEEKGRAVVDLRALNKHAVPDSYPLPLQSDVMDSIRGKGFLTVIDATSFFFQFLVHPDYRDRFTVVSHRGLERSTVALMGYKNSPAYAQRFMDQLLLDHKKYCRAFIDDIIIFSDTFEDHVKHLETVFQLFTDKNIAISPKKSFIGYPSVELLGFYVDAFGLATTDSRIQGFKDLTFPTTLKALEGYLGAAGFLRTMVSYFAQLAAPLQNRKTALLTEGRNTGKTDNPGARASYTRSKTFEPTEAELQSFNALQSYLCTRLRLSHVHPDRTLFLQIDGSLEHGFGVVVFHLKPGCTWEPKTAVAVAASDIDPVMFLSRCLTKAELSYGPSELEVACLVWACKRLRTVLHSLNKPVIVLTDHDATRGIVNQTSLNTTSTDRANRRLVNASIYLSAYDLEVHHLAGRLNLVPDALSRLPALGDEAARLKNDTPTLDNLWDHDQVLFIAEAQMDADLHKRFAIGYEADSIYGNIIKDLASTPSNGRRPDVGHGHNEVVVNASKPGHPFRLVDGLLYNGDSNGKERLVIPKPLVKEVLNYHHDEKHHFGRTRMLQDMDGLHFRKKRFLVDQYVNTCHQCGAIRQETQLPIGEYTPIQAPLEPMHTIAMDFIVGLPLVPSANTPWQHKGFNAYNALLTVTCKSSKRSLLLPGHESYTAEDWAQVLGTHLLLADWACPKVIISDRDAKFTSRFWNALWKTFRTRLMMTTAYHPQSDGQSEQKNKVVELAVRYHAYEHPEENWVDLMPSLQWDLNGAYSRVIDASPHEYLFGFKIAGPLDRLTTTTTTSMPPKEVVEMRFMREALRQDAHFAMDVAAAAAKRLYDAKHRQVQFDKGDKVWLTLGKAYKLPGNPSRKVSPRRAGPYTIIRKVTPLAYELELPASTRIHPVISIQYLSAYNCDEDPFERRHPAPGPLEYNEHSDSSANEDEKVFELDRIVDHKPKKGPAKKYLVRWKGYEAKDDQWRTTAQLKHARELITEYEDRLKAQKQLQGRLKEATASATRRSKRLAKD